MRRLEIITKEAMEKYCKGEEYPKVSVNNDLESLFENLRLGKEPDESVWTYFLPKLTREELKLVKTKEKTYLQTFVKGYFGGNPDVEEGEMELSESDLKFFLWKGLA